MLESGKSSKKKLKLIVKCLRNTRDRQRAGSHIPTSPTTSRTDAVRYEKLFTKTSLTIITTPLRQTAFKVLFFCFRAFIQQKVNGIKAFFEMHN